MRFKLSARARSELAMLGFDAEIIMLFLLTVLYLLHRQESSARVAFNIAIDLLGMVVMTVIHYCCVAEKKNTADVSYFLLIVFFGAGYLFGDGIAAVYEGNSAREVFSHFASACLFISSVAIMLCFWRYISAIADRPPRTWLRIVIFALTVAYFVAVILNFPFRFLYVIDGTGHFNRGPFAWLTFAAPLIIGWITVIFALTRNFSAVQIASILAISLVPMAGIILQFLWYGISFISIAVTVAVLIVFALIHTRRGVLLAEKESEMEKQRTVLTLSQIQPHFLYNSLNSIHELCSFDPEAAADAIDQFSGYLRMNLRSLTAKAPIPFGDELQHVKFYLQMEKMRFDDLLTVSYQIDATDFFIPALTVQPLVENAVNHGLFGRPKGGTLTVTAREKEDCFEIVVADDGVGFDINAEPTGKGTHIGIPNIRQRLADMIGGTLTIDSTVGVGTTATIRIPKERGIDPTVPGEKTGQKGVPFAPARKGVAFIVKNLKKLKKLPRIIAEMRGDAPEKTGKDNPSKRAKKKGRNQDDHTRG